MRPARESIRSNGHSYFVSSQTIQRKPFFRHERWALLLQEVLQHYRGDSYLLHAYVIMPDHFHILISPQASLERAMQNIKGGYSFRAKKAFEWTHDIWQPGFSDHRIRDAEDWDRHIGYILRNPVKARLCERSEDYRYLATGLDPIPQGLKPLTLQEEDVRAEARTLQNEAGVAEVHTLQDQVGMAEACALQDEGAKAQAYVFQNPAGMAEARTLQDQGTITQAGIFQNQYGMAEVCSLQIQDGMTEAHIPHEQYGARCAFQRLRAEE